MSSSSESPTQVEVSPLRGAVTIRTLEGAEYRFPDVDEKEFKFALRYLREFEIFSLANVSGASMVLPSRIVSSVEFDGRVVWTR